MKYTETNHYECKEDFIQLALDTPKEYRRSAWETSDSRNDFTGSKSMNDSIKIAQEGYELDSIETMLDGVKSSEGFELTQSFEVSGGEVEMGRYMEGIPECMIEFGFMESKKFIHLVIGSVEAGRTTNKKILNRAAAICGIIDALEQDNYRVKLSLVMACEKFAGTTKTQLNVIDIKDYKQPLSMAEVAGIIHTGFFRRIFWGMAENHKWGRGKTVGNTSVSSDTDILKGLKVAECITDNFIYLPSITEQQGGTMGLRGNDFQEYESAKQYIADVMNNLDKLTVLK